MLALMSDWDANLPRLDALAGDAERLGKPVASVRLLAPITNPGGIFCTGANYSDHAAEMMARLGRPAPPDPRLAARPAGLPGRHVPVLPPAQRRNRDKLIRMRHSSVLTSARKPRACASSTSAA